MKQKKKLNNVPSVLDAGKAKENGKKRMRDYNIIVLYIHAKPDT